jgi:hypothetical protein
MEDAVALVKLSSTDPLVFAMVDYSHLLVMSKQYVLADQAEKSSDDGNTDGTPAGFIKYAANLPVTLNREISQEALTAVSVILRNILEQKPNSDLEEEVNKLEFDDRVACMEILHWLDLNAPWRNRLGSIVTMTQDTVICIITDSSNIGNKVHLDYDIWCGPCKEPAQSPLNQPAKRARLDTSCSALIFRKPTQIRGDKQIKGTYYISNSAADELRNAIVDAVIKRAALLTHYGEVSNPAIEVVANFVARNVNFLMPSYEDVVRYANLVQASRLFTHANDLMMLAIRGLQCNGVKHPRFTPPTPMPSRVGRITINMSEPDETRLIVGYNDMPAPTNGLPNLPIVPNVPNVLPNVVPNVPNVPNVVPNVAELPQEVEDNADEIFDVED